MDATSHSAWDAVPVPLLVLDERIVRYANPALLALLGIRAAEIVDRPVADMLTDRFLATEDVGWTRATEGTAVPESLRTAWVRVRSADGTLRMMCVRGALLGKDKFLLAVLNAEAEHAAQELTHALADGARRLLHLRDEREVLEQACEVARSLDFGASVFLLEGDEFVQGPLRVHPRIEAAFREMTGENLVGARVSKDQMRDVYDVLVSGRVKFRQDVHRIIDSMHPEELATQLKSVTPRVACEAPIRVEDVPYAVLSIMGDHLTPVGAGAIELFALQVGAAIENVRHHARAAERLRQLEQMQKELVTSERLAALGEAAAVLAHEIRNPLGVLLNATAVLGRDPALSGDSALVVSTVEEETLRLDRLVNDLLQFVRPLSPRPRETHLGGLARKVVGRLQEPAEVQIEVEEPLPVRAAVDPDLIHIVLDNLLRNAVQVSPAGAKVTVRIESDATGAVVAVEDEGPGVPEEDRERIFAPFFTTRARGTGLGLALARRIADAHSGTVRVVGGRKCGARFELLLPRRS